MIGVRCFLWHSHILQKTKIFETKKDFKIIFLVCLFGFCLGLARTGVWMSFNHSGVLDDLVNKKVSVTGVVIEEPQISDASSKIILKTLPSFLASTSVAVSGGALLQVTADRYTTIKYGDEIKVYGKVIVPQPIKSPDGDFAYDVYLARQGIFYTMIFPSTTLVSPHHGNPAREFLINVKNNFLAKVDELFTSPQSGLLAGLLVSGRSSLSKAEQALFTQAGLIHIVALSGFNVTIIAQGLMALLIFLPKKVRLTIGALGIIAFVTMTGFGSTVVRAGIMALLVIAAALVHREYSVGRALFMAVLCMVIWNPMVVYDVSFQLSCVATFAVIFAVPPALIKYSSRLKFLPAKFKIRETMLGTAVIEIFLLPILLATSGKISLVTVITNLLILPPLPIVMGFGFVATLVGYLNYFLAMPLVVISNLMLNYILFITNFFANIPFGVFTFALPTWAVFLIYGILIFWLYKLQKEMPTKNPASETTTGLLQNLAGAPVAASALTQANLERVENFLQSHSNSNYQKKP